MSAGSGPMLPAPPVQPPQGQAGAALVQEDRVRALLQLLHSRPSEPGDLEKHAEALGVDAILESLPPQPSPQYGELPGQGYLYQNAPEERQSTMVETTPEVARSALLRAVEVCANNAQLPFSEHTPDQWGKAALELSQAYLLLDPTVDTEGIPVGAAAAAEGEAKEGVEHARGAATAAAGAHVAQATAETQGARFSHPVTAAGHPEPPRVQDNPAEQAVANKNKGKTEVLRGARGDRPRPQPRVGS